MTTEAHGSERGVYHLTVIMHEADEGGYWAEVVELPGCMSQGETQEETLANVREAFLAILETYTEDNEPLPLQHSASVRELLVPMPA